MSTEVILLCTAIVFLIISLWLYTKSKNEKTIAAIPRVYVASIIFELWTISVEIEKQGNTKEYFDDINNRVNGLIRDLNQYI